MRRRGLAPSLWDKAPLLCLSGDRGAASPVGARGAPPGTGVSVVGLVLPCQLNTVLLDSLHLDFKRLWLPESRAQRESAFPVSIPARMAFAAVRRIPHKASSVKPSSCARTGRCPRSSSPPVSAVRQAVALRPGKSALGAQVRGVGRGKQGRRERSGFCAKELSLESRTWHRAGLKQAVRNRLNESKI